MIENKLLEGALLAYMGAFSASNLDDLGMDIRYVLGGIKDKVKKKKNIITMDELEAENYQNIAIIVPAWQEARVIKHMLEDNFAKIDYPSDKYSFVVGTYPNDLSTNRSIDGLIEQYGGRLHKVVNPLDGPTSKADNLNSMLRRTRAMEEGNGKQFGIIIVHDAEDDIHPQSLKLFNKFVPGQYDALQLPVFAKRVPVNFNPKTWRDYLVNRLYCDDFAEGHTRELPTKQRIKGYVPSAGAGMGFSRGVLERYMKQNGGEVFKSDSLTEDYVLSIMIQQDGLKFGFMNPKLVIDNGNGKKHKEFIATLEYFPDKFGAAVRQRTRWATGITLQAPKYVGFKGKLAQKYTLLRDKKALITNPLSMSANLLAGAFIADYALKATGGTPLFVDTVFPIGSPQWYMMYFNLAMMVNRYYRKMRAINKVYGPKETIGSFITYLPRTVYGNILNGVSTFNSWGKYLKHKITRKPLKWSKTSHVYEPTNGNNDNGGRGAKP